MQNGEAKGTEEGRERRKGGRERREGGRETKKSEKHSCVFPVT